MQYSPLEYVLDRLPFGNNLQNVTPELLDNLIRGVDTQPWHRFAILSRQWRRHACTATRWLNEVLPRDALVFEPGCGSGANLLWLGQKGITRLSGSDVDPGALELGRRLGAHLGLTMDLWTDDAVHPTRLPENLDGIVSVNWLYHIEGATFEGFLSTYGPTIRPGGYLACDMVTRSYDRTPNNRYHTDDWKLPVEQRRPSEYKIRLSRGEMEGMGRDHGFELVRSTTFLLTKPQRAVYLFRKVDW